MIGISGIGAYIPEHSIPISELIPNITEDKIKSFGVQSILWEPKLSAIEMAEKASRMAIDNAGINVEEIDTIINTQASIHDYLMWIAAADLQYRLGARNASFFDIYQGCSGFVEGIKIAECLIESGRAEKVLVASAEKWDCAIRKRYIGKMVYGEGGAAVVVEKDCRSNVVLGHSHISLGYFNDISRIQIGAQNPPENEHMLSEYDFSVVNLEKSKNELLPINIENFYIVGEKAAADSGITVKDLNAIIFPSAGFGLMEKVIKRYDFDLSATNHEYMSHAGDCGTVDVIISLYRMLKDKKIKKGDNVLILAQGAGFVWNSIIIKI